MIAENPAYLQAAGIVDDPIDAAPEGVELGRLDV
jgi:hypothetical protein